MDKATEIARQINYMCFSGFEKSDFDQECCANLIRQHLAQEWISVEDRLPEQICNCLIYFSAHVDISIRSIGWAFFNSQKKFFIATCYADNVTHWMPLPETPEALLTAPNQYMDLCDDSLPEASQ